MPQFRDRQEYERWKAGQIGAAQPGGTERPATPGSSPVPGWKTRRIVLLVVGAVGLLALLAAAIVGGVVYLLKSSDAYRVSEAFIRDSAEIRAVVGDPLELGWFPTGSIELYGGGAEGTAELNITVKGAAGSTTVYVALRKNQGQWRVVAATYTDRSGTVRRLRPGQSS